LQQESITLQQRVYGWSVHIFTASGAFVGVLALNAIYHQNYLQALWLMCLSTTIDAVDGMLARRINIKEAVPEIDGAMLDNIVDFFNYMLVPAFFLMVSNLLPENWKLICVLAIVLSSSFQFAQVDAKTKDHFFKGFPSYWNIAVFYLFFWGLSPTINIWILLLLAFLSFVPIKYVYPSRLDYLSDSMIVRKAMLLFTILWGCTVVALLAMYPESNKILVAISMSYIVCYLLASIYRTWYPLSK